MIYVIVLLKFYEKGDLVVQDNNPEIDCDDFMFG